MSWGWGWRPYVPVAKRREKARRYAQKLARQGQKLHSIEINGRTIARTFWGQAWCNNLESYSDFANRLPRGRTYVRNGSVVDLQIAAGKVAAIVSGSEIYKVGVEIERLRKPEWTKITRDCARSIDSLMDLLAGRLSQGVMERLTRQTGGLFPRPGQIKMHCSCPDWATLCKHVAAVLYGVGARLDHEPELLFVLRQVDHLKLVAQAADSANLDAALGAGAAGALAADDLGELFGIDLTTRQSAEPASEATSATRRPRRKRSAETVTPPSGAAANQPPAGKKPRRSKKAGTLTGRRPRSSAASTSTIATGSIHAKAVRAKSASARGSTRKTKARLKAGRKSG